ncbi:MAG: hypothetical protein HYX63_21755 [Gammaproteobacteria bacterium]|nr:hypothetical protein [Gammaproteobacteria bacterium]
MDTVARKLEQMIKTLNTDLIVLWISVDPAPLDGLLKSNELLVEKVLPEIGVSLTRFKPKLRSTLTTPTWRQKPTSHHQTRQLHVYKSRRKLSTAYSFFAQFRSLP